MMRQPPRLLLVMQTPDASTGRCGRKLRERGYALDCCYLLAGQPLPAGMDGYTGVIATAPTPLECSSTPK